MTLINILIFIFTLLLVYQIYGLFKPTKMIEGLKNDTSSESNNTPKNSGSSVDNNCLALSQKNSGNIEVLKDQMNDLNGIKNNVSTMENDIQNMQTQINQLSQQQSDYASQMAGSTPPNVTGTDPETADDV